MANPKRWMVAIGLLPLLAPGARAQVAFMPSIGSIPDGVSMAVTPVVTADRRYVRLSLDVQFTGVIDFTTFPVPGAVSGGPGGPGALGGLGGGLGGLGGGRGGGGGGQFASVPPDLGGSFAVGMNGLVNEAAAYENPYAQPFRFGMGTPSAFRNDPFANEGSFRRVPAVKTTKSHARPIPHKATHPASRKKGEASAPATRSD